MKKSFPSSPETLARQSFASIMLDLIRGCAALAVLLCHARVVLLHSMDNSISNPGVRLFYLTSSFGNLAVMIFFVLSGYLVGGSVIRAVQSGTWSWRRYFLARGTRLYIVLIPALLGTLVLDRFEFAKTQGALGNSDTGQAIITSGQIHQNSTLLNAVGTLAFLQTILVPPVGSNTALWSLANEFWYYLIFPCLYLAIWGRQPWHSRLCFLVLGVAMLIFVGSTIAIDFSVWLSGAIVSQLPRLPRNCRSPLVGWLSVLFFTSGMVLVALGKIPTHDARKMLATASFIPWFIWITMRTEKMQALWIVQTSWFLSSFSFTLYAIHLPVLMLFRAYWTHEQPWPATLTGCLGVVGVCVVVVLIAWIVSLGTEARTDSVRRWLEVRLFHIRRTDPGMNSP